MSDSTASADLLVRDALLCTYVLYDLRVQLAEHISRRLETLVRDEEGCRAWEEVAARGENRHFRDTLHAVLFSPTRRREKLSEADFLFHLLSSATDALAPPPEPNDVRRLRAAAQGLKQVRNMWAHTQDELRARTRTFLDCADTVRGLLQLPAKPTRDPAVPVDRPARLGPDDAMSDVTNEVLAVLGSGLAHREQMVDTIFRAHTKIGGTLGDAFVAEIAGAVGLPVDRARALAQAVPADATHPDTEEATHARDESILRNALALAEGEDMSMEVLTRYLDANPAHVDTVHRFLCQDEQVTVNGKEFAYTSSLVGRNVDVAPSVRVRDSTAVDPGEEPDTGPDRPSFTGRFTPLTAEDLDRFSEALSVPASTRTLLGQYRSRSTEVPLLINPTPDANGDPVEADFTVDLMFPVPVAPGAGFYAVFHFPWELDSLVDDDYVLYTPRDRVRGVDLLEFTLSSDRPILLCVCQGLQNGAWTELGAATIEPDAGSWRATFRVLRPPEIVLFRYRLA